MYITVYVIKYPGLQIEVFANEHYCIDTSAFANGHCSTESYFDL